MNESAVQEAAHFHKNTAGCKYKVTAWATLSSTCPTNQTKHGCKWRYGLIETKWAKKINQTFVCLFSLLSAAIYQWEN